MESNATNLVRRLEILERENRRLKRFGVGVLGLVGVVGLTSLVAPRLCKTVWAERFVLNDGSGNTRLMLDAYSSGAPTIVAQDKDGRTFAKLTLAGEKPCLEFYDANGECAGKIGISEGKPFVERSKSDAVAMR
jgi:hypothetical protein